MQISVFHPASPQAAEILWLWNWSMWVCGFLLAIVTISIVYIAYRFRQRDNRDPPQITGNKKLEILWTAVPLGLVTLLFVLSVVTARAVDRPVRRAPDILVTGHQWWWEVRYPAAGVITANEIHMPVGRDMLVQVETADVIHDFWVPRLGRKIDALPGFQNFIWIHPDAAGEYEGACAEYCGAQHAWMRFRVIAQEPAAYDSWLAAQSASAMNAPGGDAANGQKLFADRTCANCHNIRGLNTQKQYAPDLTHVATREMLASDRLINTPENMRDWLREPNVIKPGCYMPNLELSNQDLTQLTAFLETLK